MSTISACLERISACFERACKVDRLRAGTLGKEPARDARGGERESNCGAGQALRVPDAPPASQSRLALSDGCRPPAPDRRRQWSRLRCGTTGRPNLRRNGPPRPDEPGESFPIGGVVLRGLARKSRGGPPVGQRGPKLRMTWRERRWPARLNSARVSAWRMEWI